jgi:hypothetical protein
MWKLSVRGMQRQEAISKASKFLGRKHDAKTGGTARKIKDRAKKNPDLNRAGLNQAIADIYQRGVNPKDLDLEKIDFSVSYSNIRSQIQDLLDKRGAEKFGSRKDAERKSQMSYAQKKGSETLKTIASVRHERRPPHNQYTDETKDADRTFGRLTEESFRKWSRNPNKYDIEGVDGKKKQGSQQPLPFQRNSRIKEMRIADAEQELGEPEERDLGISDSEKLDWEIGGAPDLKDSRSSKQVGKDLKGSTSERSSQQSLREGGFASKSSEKTLDNFSESVSESGKEVSDKWSGNYV